jgi:hypothetical protein
MKGTRILISSPTKGVYEDIIVSGTPKPGTCMELKPATEPEGNIFTYEAYGVQAASGGKFVSNDGDRKAIAVLLEKDQEGKTYNDAYADGDRGRVYFPAAGEELNMLFENQSGTGDAFAIGDEAMVGNGTGKLLACDSDAEAHPFTVRETVAALTADAWIRCRFNGEGGA